jgi:hypothetical protein
LQKRLRIHASQLVIFGCPAVAVFQNDESRISLDQQQDSAENH